MRVEIWSDIACPWCWIGKHRFETALAGFEHRDEVEIVWRSFELDPDAPPEREGDRTERLARKYGTSREQAEAMERHIAAEAAKEGIELRFDIARGGNMFDAHRVVQLAKAHGRQDEVKERLMRAYLGEGELLSDPATLERLAMEAGLPGDEVAELLAGERFAAEVRDDERTAAELGISAVPFFVADRAIAASGAQPPELFAKLLSRAWDSASGAAPVRANDGH
jgi:predicted DsbA family dithiol-disulfide isomerase